MVTRLIVVTILECVEISNHYAMYQEVTCGRSLILCGRSLFLQNEESNQLLEKENRFVVTGCKGVGKLGRTRLDKGSQKVQTSSWKISKY